MGNDALGAGDVSADQDATESWCFDFDASKDAEGEWRPKAAVEKWLRPRTPKRREPGAAAQSARGYSADSRPGLLDHQNRRTGKYDATQARGGGNTRFAWRHDSVDLF